MLKLKKMDLAFTTLILLGGLTVVAVAADRVSQIVTITVVNINSILISGGVNLNVNVPDGSATDTSTTISYSTNAVNRKITAELNDPLPTDIKLKIEVEGGTGQQTLSATPVDVITGLSKSVGTKKIAYTAIVDPQVSPQTVTRVVIFTIINEG